MKKWRVKGKTKKFIAYGVILALGLLWLWGTFQPFVTVHTTIWDCKNAFTLYDPLACYKGVVYKESIWRVLTRIDSFSMWMLYGLLLLLYSYSLLRLHRKPVMAVLSFLFVCLATVSIYIIGKLPQFVERNAFLAPGSYVVISVIPFLLFTCLWILHTCYIGKYIMGMKTNGEDERKK